MTRRFETAAETGEDEPYQIHESESGPGIYEIGGTETSGEDFYHQCRWKQLEGEHWKTYAEHAVAMSLRLQARAFQKAHEKGPMSISPRVYSDWGIGGRPGNRLAPSRRLRYRFEMAMEVMLRPTRNVTFTANDPVGAGNGLWLQESGSSVDRLRAAGAVVSRFLSKRTSFVTRSQGFETVALRTWNWLLCNRLDVVFS
ncbi:hypothetical protein SELMODRAFT_430442 [Selaginella moellendorffii]|uniref:Uncharacterized protein n=1 Tax=Selaginella moellendorffii TaxID=88036 RepID=D8T9F5_SELML|nr:hypothetical protein SELMODRAFT_430442 [Selaginella moellendorffii]